MKIYFFEDGRKAVMDFAEAADEPECVASFPIASGKSTLAARYALEEGKLVDKFSGKTDEEVATALQAAEAAKAAEIAAQNTPAPAP